MAKEVDYVQFVRDFERQHGRPPTAEELERGTDPLAGIVTWSTPEEVQAEMDRINASYKPTIGERVTDGLSLLGRGLFKAVILLFQTPIYLTLFFFNLIKTTIAVPIIFLIIKGGVGVVMVEVLQWQNIDTLSEAPRLIRFLGQDFMTNDFLPIYFTDIDIVICIVFIVFLALVATFSKTEHKER